MPSMRAEAIVSRKFASRFFFFLRERRATTCLMFSSPSGVSCRQRRAFSMRASPSARPPPENPKRRTTASARPA